MSVAVRSIQSVLPNPWARLQEDWPDLPVRFVSDLGGTRHGKTRWIDRSPREILLHVDLCQVERRVALAHELEHLDRGAPCESLQASIEARVLRATARWLIPDLGRLAETLATYDLHRAAHELWVTYPCLVDRLNGLTDNESLYVHAFREDIA